MSDLESQNKLATPLPPGYINSEILLRILGTHNASVHHPLLLKIEYPGDPPIPWSQYFGVKEGLPDIVTATGEAKPEESQYYGVNADGFPPTALFGPSIKALMGEGIGNIGVGKSYSGRLDTTVSGPVASEQDVHSLVEVTGNHTRGVRLNNFGNINDGDFTRHQIGYAGHERDNGGREAAYTKPEYGVLAADALLDKYASGGLTTVHDIIMRWAPPSENDTASYINALARGMGFAKGDAVVTDSPAMRAKFLSLMFRVECGMDPLGEERIRFILEHKNELRAGVDIDTIPGWDKLKQGISAPEPVGKPKAKEAPSLL